DLLIAPTAKPSCPGERLGDNRPRICRVEEQSEGKPVPRPGADEGLADPLLEVAPCRGGSNSSTLRSLSSVMRSSRIAFQPKTPSSSREEVRPGESMEEVRPNG